MTTTTPNGDPGLTLRETSLRPMRQTGRGFWILFWILTALVVTGGVAWIVQLSRGFTVTGLNQNVTWGVYTANLVFFIGLSYGGAVVSAILRLTGARWRASIARLAEACALVTLIVGAAFPFIHMGRPERVWRMFVEPNGTSPMVWDTFAILTYLLATMVFFYLPLIPDLGTLLEHKMAGANRFRKRLWAFMADNWRSTPEQVRTLERSLNIMAVLIIPIAIVVHSVLAWAFSVTTRPGWHSTIFAPYFVIAALFSGVALVIIVAAAYRAAYKLHAYIHDIQFRFLGYIMLSLGLLYAYFTFAEYLTDGYASTEHGIAVLSMLLTGRYAWLFWGWIALGIVVPILLVAIPRTRTVAGLTTAASLVVVGMWVKRVLIVVPPMELALVGHEIVPYFPSLVEILITLAGFAGIPWLLMILFRFVPVLPIYEIEMVAHEKDDPELERVAQPTGEVPSPLGGALGGGA